MSFQDTMEGFDFDAHEVFRATDPHASKHARGRLVQAAMEQNYPALHAVLDACAKPLARKDAAFVRTLTTCGRFEGARTGPTGKIAEIKGSSSPIGAMALACMYANPKDSAAREYEKRFQVLAVKLPPAARETILLEMLANGRDARHANQVAKHLARAALWHPSPSQALLQLARSKAFPRLQTPTAGVTGLAITASLKRLTPSDAMAAFDAHTAALVAVFTHQGGFRQATLDRLAEVHVLRACIDGTATEQEQCKLPEILSRHAKTNEPLENQVLGALGRKIMESNLSTVEAFGPIIQRASRNGQYLFLKSTVGDATMLDALIGLRAHQLPPDVNLANAMLGRHMQNLHADHAPAIETLLKAGADPFQKFALTTESQAQESGFGAICGVSLDDLLKKEKNAPAWKESLRWVAAKKAQKALAKPKRTPRKTTAPALP